VPTYIASKSDGEVKLFTIKALNISINIPKELDSHNQDLVGYIIQKYPRKIVKGTILTRVSIEHWYKESLVLYPDDRYIYLLGTVSLVGEIRGTTELAPESNTKYPSKKDPSAN
jgi:hypothetical protein